MTRVFLPFAALLACSLGAQDLQPPKVIRIFREEIKPGRDAAHERAEGGYVRAFTKHNYPVHYIALKAMSGPSEAWFAEAHDSFTSIESVEQQIEKSPLKAELDTLSAQDGEYRASDRTVLAVFRPDLSYKPEEAVDRLPKSRYVMVTTYRARPGRDRDFTELAKKAIDAYQRSNSEAVSMGYQVVTGMPSGTYLVFTPMQSMKVMDDYPARSKAWAEAMGDSMQDFMKTIQEAMLPGESNVFQLSPKMSYVSKDFAAKDPEFWAQKAAPASKKTESADRSRKP